MTIGDPPFCDGPDQKTSTSPSPGIAKAEAGGRGTVACQLIKVFSEVPPALLSSETAPAVSEPSELLPPEVVSTMTNTIPMIRRTRERNRYFLFSFFCMKATSGLVKRFSGVVAPSI